MAVKPGWHRLVITVRADAYHQLIEHSVALHYDSFASFLRVIMREELRAPRCRDARTLFPAVPSKLRNRTAKPR